LENALSVFSAQDKFEKLSPEPYREQIEAIEKILYRHKPADFGEIKALGRLSAELGEEILLNGSLLQRPAASRIIFWGDKIGGMEDTGFRKLDLKPIRFEWEKLREDCFQSASWFRTATGN